MDLERDKEMKVHLPLRLHELLHRYKMLRGVSFSHAVSEALDLYFSQLEAQDGRGHAPAHR